jgi:hypothetical protein
MATTTQHPQAPAGTAGARGTPRPPPAGERSQGEGGLGYPEQGGAPAPHSVNPWFLRTSFT